MFHGVDGNNYQTADSPSWYNPEEATQVYFYLLKLYNRGLLPKDIGIITPYQKQVMENSTLYFKYLMLKKLLNIGYKNLSFFFRCIKLKTCCWN